MHGQCLCGDGTRIRHLGVILLYLYKINNWLHTRATNAKPPAWWCAMGPKARDGRVGRGPDLRGLLGALACFHDGPGAHVEPRLGRVALSCESGEGHTHLGRAHKQRCGARDVCCSVQQRGDSDEPERWMFVWGCAVHAGGPACVDCSLPLTGAPTKSYQDKGDSGQPVYRHFCGNCGSPVFSEVTVTPQLDWIKAGILDDTREVRPTASIWCSSAQPWVVYPEGMARFAENPPAAA